MMRMPFQQNTSPLMGRPPMQVGIGGLGGGLDDRVFAPLKNMLSQHLTQSVVQEKVEPFVEEVRDMAEERFDLGGGGTSYGQIGAPQFKNQVQPFTGMSFQPTVEPPSGLIKGFGNRIFEGYADGGPVAAGLGSFLASNIDEFGRNGDTEVIHATKSEVVLPKGMVDNPEVRQTVRDLFEQTGRDMQEYTVGSGQMNVNPMTGYEEAFDLIGGIKDIFKKAAPVLLPLATTFMFPGMSPFLSRRCRRSFSKPSQLKRFIVWITFKACAQTTFHQACCRRRSQTTLYSSLKRVLYATALN